MFLEDRLINFVSGLGTDKDKSTHARHYRTFIDKNELDSAYTSSWLSAQIIDVPCDDMTREWRKWNGGPRQSRYIAKTEHALRVRERVNQALKMARLYGGAAILIGVNGDDDPTTPLDPKSIGKGDLKYLHALSRYEIWAAAIDRDPFSPYYSEPVYYTVHSAGPAPSPIQSGPVSQLTSSIDPNRPMGAVYVHPSRVIRFLGPTKLELSQTLDGWGISILQRCREAIIHAEQTAGNLAALTNEAKIDVLRIPGLTQNIIRDDYRTKLQARFTQASMAKSINNMLILDREEEWDQKTPSFGGLDKVLELYLQIVAGAADIPLTRLLGTTSPGLNANGAENTRNYYDSLASRQEIELRPGLERLDEMLIRHAIGSRPEELDFEWLPLWQMRENESAALHLQKAQMNQIYATVGVMSKEAMAKSIQGQLVADHVYPGLEELLETTANQPVEPLVQKQQESGEINTPTARATTAKP